MKSKLKVLVGSVAVAMAGQASADFSWTLTNTPTAGVAVNAYANTSGADVTGTNAQNQKIEGALWVSAYGGITNKDKPVSGTASCNGVADCDAYEGSTSSPYEHAIDNNQRYDMALLTFDSNIMLTSVKLGFANTDSDITVMAYTGANPFSLGSHLTGQTYDQLAGLGWKTVGNYANVGTAVAKDITSTNLETINGNVYSSYWLIGAYNPLAAGATTGLNGGNDYVKLKSVTGIVCTDGTGPNCKPPDQVPEPGSLALVGFALMGMMGLRKRRHV